MNHKLMMRPFVFLCCFSLACSASEPVRFEVELVTTTCGEAVLQIQDSAHYAYGETWNGHDHVFFTVFDCTVDIEKLQEGPFMVTLVDEPGPQDCARCLATLDYSGNKKYHVRVGL